jgi:sulfhydrogenase subunit beta (sulfur reductase)
MYNIYYIESGELSAFFNKLKKSYTVFSPVAREHNFTEKTDYGYEQLREGEAAVFNPYRTIEPIKTFFTHPQEELVGYFHTEKDVTLVARTVVLGVKSCDLAGHKVQDFVFLEGVEVDSLYRIRRENTIFISSDCTDFKSVCHCLAWEILPYPTEGFDLNLSPLNDGYVVEVGSKKGEELIQQNKEYFLPAKDQRS